MEIPPVLMQLLLTGQGLEKLLAAVPDLSAPMGGGKGQPGFGFTLAQEVAPAIAAVLGKPVLVLPDGGIVLEYYPSNVPPGGIVVSPPSTHAESAAPVLGEDAADGEPIVEEGAEKAPIWAFPPTLGPPYALSSQAKLLDEGMCRAEEPEPSFAALRSAAVYRLAERTCGHGSPMTKGPPSQEGSTVPAAGTSAGEPGSVPPAGPMSANAAVGEAAEMADATVVGPKAEGTAGSSVVRDEAAFGKKGAGILTPGPRGTPSVAHATGELAETQAPVSVYGKAATAESGPISLKQALAHLTSEGVKFEVHHADIGVGVQKASANVGDGTGSIVSASSAGTANVAVPEAPSEGQGEAFQDAGQSSGEGDSKPQNEPVQAVKFEELLGRQRVEAAHGSKILSDSSLSGAASEAAHTEPPRVLSETPAVQQALDPTSSGPQHSGNAQTVGEAVEYPATRGLAFRDSMADLAVKSVRYLVSEGEKSLRVRLVPESLGEVRVEIVSVRDELHLRLVSGNASVRDAMEHGADMLRNALARDGVNIVRVTVASDGGPPEDYGSFSGRGAADGNAQNATRHNGSWNRSYGNGRTTFEGRSVPEAYHDGLLSLYA